jgi:hypothetical protein
MRITSEKSHFFRRSGFLGTNLRFTNCFAVNGGITMAKKAKKRKYSKSSSGDVKSEIKRYKTGKAKSGRKGKSGKVKSKKQAIAIGLSKARKKGKKVPKKSKS